MSRREYNTKMNLTLTGTSFVDETHINVGASAFYIDHDFFFDDDASGDVLVIRTAAAGGGTLLTRDTDFTITNQDSYLTTETGKNCYSTVTVINVAYQATTLYFSGKYVADAVDKEDVGRVTWQYSAVNASATLAPTGYTTYGCTAGTNGIALTLPTVSMAYTNLKLEFIKLDDTNSAVTIAGTISGLTNFYLIEQYQRVTIICNGTDWTIISGTRIADSGWINQSDWTNVHLGTTDITFDGKSAGSFQLGELVKEATSNNTGIIVGISATVLNIWRATGTGIWTNDRVITGQISGTTANVNNASTTKNLDRNFFHGFAKGFYNLNIQLWYSSDKSEANSVKLIEHIYAGPYGITFLGVDTNNFTLNTGSSGIAYLDTAGALQSLAANDVYYRIVTKLVI
jgi:hypothetical protein